MSSEPMDHTPRDHCIMGRYVTRRGQSGLPESHREIACFQERHIASKEREGWRVLIRDSEVLPSQDNEQVESD
jgi:hypothetical protein